MMNKIKSEQGDILILFAATLIMIIFFLAATSDIVLAFSKKERLEELADIMLELRIDASEELWNSESPAHLYNEYVQDIARKNNLRPDQVHIGWTDMPTQPGYENNQRIIKVDVLLTDNYETSILKMFGIENLPIRVKKSGMQDKYTTAPFIWRPGM